MKCFLEELVNKCNFIKEKASSYAVNSITGIVFYAPLMFTYETLIRQYSIQESLGIRKKAAIWGVVIPGLYGYLRNVISYVTHTNKDSSKKKKLIVETLNSYTFNAIAYTGLLLYDGLDFKNSLVTALGGAIVFGVTGRIYGKVLDKVREKFNLNSIYD